jgi:DNA modification methylase
VTYQLIQAPANKIPLPDESIQCVVTSPPYWGLRKYDGVQDLIWGGSSLCEHDFKESINFDNSKKGNEGSTTASNPGHAVSDRFKSVSGICFLCGAWRGGFGLEPSLKLYIQHTVEILRELKRILKPNGVVFWNTGDSYAGGGNYRGINSENTLTSKQASNRGAKGVHQELGALGKDSGTAKPKDLCLIPQRVAIAAQEDGWWVRQDIIWAKPNPMPESVRDRFTDAYEHIFMFTKSQKYFWDAKACQEPAISAGLVTKLGKKAFSRGQQLGSGVPEEKLHGNALATEYKTKETRNIRNVWTFATQPFKGAHFATFPEELPRRCIRAATKIGDTVLDPFCGSGTTGKVALELGRNFIGTDLAYQDLAEQRIQKAVLPVPETSSQSEQEVLVGSEFD